MQKRWLVPVVPAAFSLLLSFLTVGSYPFWQDSGVYLTAVRELGVLYAPGFALYLVLCRLWTLLLFFVDFTLAVHLFSSLCAALTSGVVALAVRDLLRSRGPLFRVTTEDPGPAAEACAILSGVLLASGFTFWSTAVYAKVYAFYYLLLSLLLWRMIRADDLRRPRDFTIVAALVGLCGHAHPSAALAGLGMLLFFAGHAGTLGAKGLAGRLGVAAGFLVGPTVLLLPMLVAHDPWLAFGEPRGVSDYIRYLTGIRFVGMHGAFGVDAGRAASFGRFLWEDFLGLGVVLLAVGLAALARRNRRLLVGVLAWTVPYAVVTILFKTEVQHDCWFVAARLPLFLAVGVGAFEIAVRARARSIPVLAGLGVVIAAWSVAANLGDVSQRRYDLAELYGRTILETPDPDAVVLLSGDDSNGLAGYLHRVKGVRPDVILVTTSFLDSEATTGTDWYDRKLLQRNPSLRKPDYRGHRERFPQVEVKIAATAAFVNANADAGRPIFSQLMIPPEMLRPDLAVVPAGVFWKIVPRGREGGLQQRYWTFPIEPEQVRARYRRARGQEVTLTAAGVEVRPERYERRLALMLLSARQRLALALIEKGEPLAAARLCQSIVDYGDDELSTSPEVVHLLGISYFAGGQPDRALPALRLSAERSARPEHRATALFYLGEIAAKQGDAEAAKRYAEAALSVPGLPPAYRREMESRLPRK